MLSLVFTVYPTVILGKSHYILYGLVAAMQPRMLVTFDEELRPLPVSVRVGQVTSLLLLLTGKMEVRVLLVFFLNICPDLVTGCGCRGPSRQAQGHHRFPDPHDAGTAGSRREGWAGNRGVSSRNTHPGGLCNPPQESQLWNLETTPQNKSLIPLGLCSVF